MKDEIVLYQPDATIHNIYKTHELDEAATCAKIAQVRIEGNRQVRREVPFYNLDMIISVDYRVNSIRGTQFRQWAKFRDRADGGRPYNTVGGRRTNDCK